MTAALHILLWLLVSAAAVPVLFVLLENLLAWLPASRRNTSAGTRPPVAVLVPAHNEQAGIAATLATIRPQLQPHDRLLVVADNCSDATADAARAAGAEAVSRQHDTQRGKGYALAFGLEHLLRTADPQHPPIAVVVIDADSTLAPGSLDALASAVAESGRPAQGIDVLLPPPNPSPRQLISSLAFTFKNVARPTGLARIGGPCLLMGTGMALPLSHIKPADLASGNIVEDMKLGIDLAIAGRPPRLCPGAKVSGTLPDSDSAGATQRTRWEHGHLATIAAHAPRLLAAALRQARPDLLLLALELSVPPLALLTVATAGVASLCAVAAFVGLPWQPAAAAVSLIALLVGAVILGWARFARDHIPFSAIAFAPLYALGKLPIYLGFVHKRQTAWVRTARAGEANPDRP